MLLKTSNIKTHSDKDKRGSDFIVTELCGGGPLLTAHHRWQRCFLLGPSGLFRLQQKFRSSSCATQHLHITVRSFKEVHGPDHYDSFPL